MEIGITETLLGIGALMLGSYYYLTFTFDYWRSRGIAGPQPKLFFGNFKQVIYGRMSIGDLVKSEYDVYKDQPLFGIFAMRSPLLVINDLELIKDVLVKHFSSFANRGVRIFERAEPLSANLVNLEPARWKPLRAKQTTMFTSAKLKEMFYLLLECAANLEKVLARSVGDDGVIEICEVTAKYGTDCIGACVFGIDMKALENENSDFRRVGRKFIHLDKWRAFKVRFKQVFPWIYELLSPFVYDHEINDFFINTMIETMEQRKKNNVRRGDFVDLLNDLRDNPDKLEGIELTDKLLTAQAFAFFFAGFDTSSLTMSHALYELALNQSIQDKVREEIHREIEGNVEYGNIENMKYLHKVFCETLRKYPVTTILTRQAMESFTFSKNQLKIPKGMRVWIPVYGIHRNPDIYPDPDKFDPERFNEENISQRHPSHYLPFGAGPRNCVGARFGNNQSKLGLITILKSYKVDVCEKTPIPYVSSKRRFLLGPASGINLKFTKIV